MVRFTFWLRLWTAHSAICQDELPCAFSCESEKIKILKEVEKDGNLRNVAIVYTLLYTGIRISELCALDYLDIEMKEKNGVLIVKDSNGQKDRIIPLTQEAIERLKRYIDYAGISEGPLFVSNANQRLSTRTVQYMLKNYNINPIKLRHTFCQELIDKGIEVSVVAQLAGHSDINMTKRYKRHSIQDVDDQAFA